VIAAVLSFLLFSLEKEQNVFMFYFSLCRCCSQATLNAREGRVMIYNLVEAAQEFLSGIEPIGISNDSVSSLFHIFCLDIITIVIL